MTEPTVESLCSQIDAVGSKVLRLISLLQIERDLLQTQVRFLSRFHPDWNTPNWCSKCTPMGIGYCRCEIACNE